MEEQTQRPIKGILKNKSSLKSGVRVLTKDDLAQDREDDQRWEGADAEGRGALPDVLHITAYNNLSPLNT